jgi:hypothetical protein
MKGDVAMLKRMLYLSVLLFFGITASCYGQFSSSLEGAVSDTTGAVIASATVKITNNSTGVSQTQTSDAKGNFSFVSLAPGSYDVTTTAQGFATHKVTVEIEAGQTMNLPVTLNVARQAQTIEVTDQAPVLDTAETRNQMTIPTSELNSLPLAGRDQLGLVTLAPGVTGLGLVAGGSNAQSIDNYAAETTVTASANGRGSVGNEYVLDGLDVSSNAKYVVNIAPNPDTIQETTVQVNTFNAEYGRTSSIVEVMTTRSGADKYHFLASDYYTANWLQARTEFQPRETTTFLPFHSDNISTTLGGPIPFLKQTYFFTAWEPLLSLTQANSQITVEDPAFTTWAQGAWPNSPEVQLLAKYPASNVSRTSVASTGSSLFPTTCGTAAAANIPCALNVDDNAVLAATNYRNALEYNIRLDKDFTKDRAYANYFRTSLYTGGPSARVDHIQPQQFLVRSIQGNETHTFSSHLLNEAAFGFLRLEGLVDPYGPFHIPIITVTGAWNTQLGVSKAHENYIQHHFIWKDNLSWVHGTHDIKFGYGAFHGDNLTYFGQWGSQPNFSFTNVANFLEGNVYQETGAYFNLLTGQQAGLASDSFQFNTLTYGFFAQDSWKVNSKLTLTYGLRWDDYGNPKGEANNIEANFFYGTGSNVPAQVTSGILKQVPQTTNSLMNGWGPRVGVAYDLTGKGKWLVHGGWGLYHDWLTLTYVQSYFTNPPAPASVTFQSNTSGPAPVFSVGTSDTWPFGFTYPTLPAATLNSQGGITGEQVNITGGDPNLKEPNTMNYAATVERGLGRNYSVAAGYSGSHSNNLWTNSVSGVDINVYPGSLIQNNGTFVRLNPNFGSITYKVNGPTATYNAFVAEFKGRFGRSGLIDTSYTHSHSWDDDQSYPYVQSNSGNYSQYWAPSSYDEPNRLSLAVSYELPHLNQGPEPLRYVTNGWKPSAVTILQSGPPFTVENSNVWKSTLVAGSPLSTSAPGNYDADGENAGMPNVPSYGYNVPHDRNHQLGRNSNLSTIPATTSGSPTPGYSGVFNLLSDFTAPATLPGEGNEVWNGYRSPGYANTDFAISKDNRIRESASLQLRLESFNLFNRASLGAITNTTNSSSFGKATSQYYARFWQIGAKFQF